ARSPGTAWRPPIQPRPGRRPRPRSGRGPSQPLAVDRIGSERRRRLEELLLGPDRFLARVERQLVVAREGEGPRGARLHTQAAHDAAQVVDLVVLRVPLPRRHGILRVVVGAFDPDGVGRTRVGAQLAPDALLQAVRVAVQAVAADVRTWRRGIDVPRVLLRHVGTEGLPEHGRQAPGDGTHRSTQRHRPVSPSLLAGGRLVRGLVAEGLLVHCGVSPADRRLGAMRGHSSHATRIAPTTIKAPVSSAPLPYTSGSTTTAPVARTHSSPMGMRNFHPKLISRSYRILGRVSRTQMYR